MSLDYAILGFLKKSPATGYELQKKIEKSINHFWTSTQSQIYRTLNRMEDDALIISEIHYQDEKPNKKVYSITEKGKEAFKVKIKELASSWKPTIHPIDVALRNLTILSKKEAIEGLEKYQKSLEETIKGYEELEKHIIEKSGHLANIQLATRRIFMLKGEKKWLENFLEEYKNEI